MSLENNKYGDYLECHIVYNLGTDMKAMEKYEE